MALSKENGIKFLCNLEGTHQRLKMLHWSTECKAEHLLTDDIDDAVLDCEDSIAENIMGKLGVRFGNGDLKSMLPESTTLKSLLDEMEDDANSFKNSIGDSDEYAGVINIIDDYLENINKWRYLSTFR